MRRSSAFLVGLVTATLLAGGCDNGPETAPTPTPGPAVTETFTGTVNLNGSVTHSFSAQGGGEVTATITALSPSGSILGFTLGTWNTVTCTAVLSNDLATQSSVLRATTQTLASLCVKLHDPNGVLTAGSVNYTVTVVHH
jgi:hypothetical protein